VQQPSVVAGVAARGEGGLGWRRDR
jgi:hypothetical protein